MDEEEEEKEKIKAFADMLQRSLRLWIAFSIELIVVLGWVFLGGGKELMIENFYVFVATMAFLIALIMLAGGTKIGWINF